MEATGDWSFCGLYTPVEEADFMVQLLAGDASGEAESGMMWAGGSLGLTAGLPDQYNPLSQAHGFGFSQDSGASTFGTSYYGGEQCGQEINNNGSLTLDQDAANANVYLADETSDCNVEDADLTYAAPTLHQRVASMPDDKPLISPSHATKKRSRGDVQQKNNRNTRSRRNQKIDGENDEEDTKRKGAAAAMSSSGCNCSDDESNGSQEIMAESSSLSSKATKALNLNGKGRASRGAATDPQSLYARKRRERINERLKILQNLVPNGTKVDISTMLEEAVHYVKFLQLQIKLLSSDEMWMYAPIAYNGMDIGLDRKLNSATNGRD